MLAEAANCELQGSVPHPGARGPDGGMEVRRTISLGLGPIMAMKL